MDLPPSELNALVKKQEDILAAAQKDGRSASMLPVVFFLHVSRKKSPLSHA